MSELIQPTRRLAFIEPNADGSVNVRIRQTPLTQEQLDEFENYTRVVFYLQPIVLSIQIVLRNYLDLKQALSASTELLQNESGAFPPMELVLNRYVLLLQTFNAFLASATTFLSQAENDVARRYGRESNEFTTFNTTRQTLHSDHFAYRFLYDLRNFSQHYSLPFSSLDLRGSKASLEAAMTTSIDLSLMRDKLLESGWNWKSLRKEIECQPPKIEALPLADEYLRVLIIICLAFAVPERSRAAEAIQYCRAAQRALDAPPSAELVLFNGEVDSKDYLKGETELFPIKQLTWLTANLEKLRQAAASSSLDLLVKAKPEET